MKLNEFIAQSLKDIIDGVVEAQEYAKTKNAFINPKGHENRNPRITMDRMVGNSREGEMISFDVAVQAKETDAAEGKVGFVLSVFGGIAGGSSEYSNTNMNRIQFNVPLYLPQQQK